MELISHEDFAALRLAQFAPEPEKVVPLTNWEFMDYLWVGEALGFMEWLRPVEYPEELRVLSLHFLDLPFAVSQRILSTLQLPLRQGMGLGAIEAILGEPLRHWQVTSGQVSYEFVCGEEWPYRVDCTIREDAGLVYLTVMVEG